MQLYHYYYTKRARSHFKATVCAFAAERGAASKPTCCATRAHMCVENPFGDSPRRTAAIRRLRGRHRERATVRRSRFGARPCRRPGHRHDPCAQVHRSRGGTCRARGPAVWYHHCRPTSPPPPHSGRETESVRAHTNAHGPTTAAARKWQRLWARVRPSIEL